MSAWTRLFGRSGLSRPEGKARLGFDSLEAREVPAIVFVGGWGASSYQYATPESNRMAERSSTGAADYSAVVFVGGWGASAAVPVDQFSVNFAKVTYDSAAPV